MREGYYQTALRFYEANRSWAGLFYEAGRPLPEEFRSLIDWLMGEQLFELIQKVDKIPYEELAKKTKEIFKEAQSHGFSVKIQPTVDFLSRRINAWIEKLFHHPDPFLVDRIEKVLSLAKELKIELYDQVTQELFFIFAQKTLHESPNEEMTQAVKRLGKLLGFN